MNLVEQELSNLKWFKKPVSTISKDSSWPKISIITPSFNQGSFIEDTILSVLNQNYPNLEFIIIDGASTDHSVEIIRKYEKYIYYWISEKDNGQTHAINKGFEKVTGEIFNWLNSDDLLAENALFEIANSFKKDQNSTVYCGREWRFMADKFINHSYGSDLSNSLETALIKAHIDQPSTYFKTSSIRSIFPLNEKLRFCMDTQLWLNYLLLEGNSKAIQTEKIISYFRYHNDSKTFINAPKFKLELLDVLSDLDHFLHQRESRYFKSCHQIMDKEFISNEVNKIQSKNEEDPSRIFRDSAAYYHYIGLIKPAKYFSKLALRKCPFKWINIKYFLAIRFKK